MAFSRDGVPLVVNFFGRLGLEGYLWSSYESLSGKQRSDLDELRRKHGFTYLDSKAFFNTILNYKYGHLFEALKRKAAPQDELEGHSRRHGPGGAVIPWASSTPRPRRR